MAMIIRRKQVSPETRYLSFCEPIPDNPVRILRNSKSLSLQELTDRSNLANKSSIIRTEQGWFDEIPESIIKGLNLDPLDAELLQDNYRDWQQLNRESHWRLFGNIQEALSKGSADDHPLEVIYRNWTIPPVGLTIGASTEFEALEYELNDTLVAKLLCLNQPTLHYFRNNPASQHRVPVSFITALSQNGYNFSEVQYFSIAYKVYRERKFNVTSSLKDEIMKELKI